MPHTDLRPIIGLTLDFEQPRSRQTTGSEESGSDQPGSNQQSGYSKFPWYAIRENYASSVVHAGGVPILLPHEAALAAHYAQMIDGLIVTGGAFDVDPGLYGAAERHGSVTTKDRRTAFELALTRAMLAADKPVLGICGGEQLLAVVRGGTLIQHIPDAIPQALAHEQPNPRDQPGHSVAITPGSLLHRLTGVAEMDVNSAHHQAVAAAGPDLTINARAPDGVIEGVEDPRYRFCLGVQWHPEFEISDGDRGIFTGFVAACVESRAR